MSRFVLIMSLLAVITAQVRAQNGAQPDQSSRAEETWKQIAFAFQPPSALAGDLGHYRSPLVFDDGRLVDLDTQRLSHLVPLISDNWRSHFRWRSQGPMPEQERQKLRGIVEKAHGKARRVRFWATPDDPVVWRELVDAGVDLRAGDSNPRLCPSCGDHFPL